eukprot:3937876-Rhodomonas_salina.9
MFCRECAGVGLPSGKLERNTPTTNTNGFREPSVTMNPITCRSRTPEQAVSANTRTHTHCHAPHSTSTHRHRDRHLSLPHAPALGTPTHQGLRDRVEQDADPDHDGRVLVLVHMVPDRRCNLVLVQDALGHFVRRRCPWNPQNNCASEPHIKSQRDRRV